jgi:two-component system cell cycle sensor histidine kinase/response regulator CckA
MNRVKPPQFPLDPTTGKSADQSFYVPQHTSDKSAGDSRAEERFHQLIEGAPNGMVMVDQGGIILVVNAQIEKMFGYDRGELIGSKIEKLIPTRFHERHPAYRETFVENPNARPMGTGRELYALRKDGTEFPVEIGLNPLKTDEGIVVVGTIIDITERRQAEQRLRRRESELAEAQRISHLGSWSWDLRTDVITWSEELFRIFGLEPAETAPSYDEIKSRFILREDREWVDKALEHSFATRESFNFYYRLRRPTGEVRVLHACGRGVTDETGKSIRFFGTAQDVTKEKEHEEKYRLLFASNPLPMWVCDLETLRFLEVNEAAIRHYGYTRDEFLSMTLLEIRPPEDQVEVTTNVKRIDSPFGKTEIWRHQKKDGSLISVEITAHSIEFEGRKARLVLANDVTERRNLEEQLKQSQKLEAIGLLAGGIAHDFNNLLTAINGYCELLKMKVSDSDPLLPTINEIHKAGSRAAELTGQLLAFGRKQVLQPKVISLNSVVAGIEPMLRRVIGENIGLTTVLDTEIGNIKVDPGQVEQVLLNLVVNAYDAMPKGGRLTIETKNVFLDEEYARMHVSVFPGHFVMMSVSDTGHGIDQATLNHIFEPFFTTKDSGKGTGLGLSTTYGIVKQSGGNIWVYSEPGKGTTFKIYFPRVDKDSNVYEPPERKGVDLSGTETILVSEDEDLVRNLTTEIMEMYGYTVLVAESGEEAVSIARDYAGNIDLLITDVVMPGMSGGELVSQITESRPGIKVLFMSGYTDNAILHYGVLDADASFIQKPFSTDGLAQKVREVLSND